MLVPFIKMLGAPKAASIVRVGGGGFVYEACGGHGSQVRMFMRPTREGFKALFICIRRWW